MDKTRVLMEIQNDLEQLIHQLSAPHELFRNWETWKEHVEHYVTLIALIKELPEFSSVKNSEPLSVVQEIIEASQKVEKESQEEKEYEFVRRLRGGVLPDFQVENFSNGYFIPEKMVRYLGISHGDFLKPIYKYTDVKRGVLYEFEISRRGNGEDLEGRKEVNHCVVEKDPLGRMYVQVKEEEMEVPEMFLLSMQDVNDFGLTVGDVVDAAYWLNKPKETFRVIWRHDTSGVIESHATVSSRNKKEPTEKERKIPNGDDLFGKKILVVGGSPKEIELKKTFSRYGADCQQVYGKITQQKLETMIPKVNAVVMIIGNLGQAGSPYVEPLCENHHVPLETVQRTGMTNVVRAAARALKSAN